MLWRGRGMDWNPDMQAIELERQRWVYERVNQTSETIAEVVRGPGYLYQVHMDEYLRTGRLDELHMALEYVTI